MKVLILRLDAPLVSFGAPAIDHHGVVQQFPTLSMLVGLFANALGWQHTDTDRLEQLQERLEFAARVDRRGEPLVDYQTVALGLPWMRAEIAGWTTKGRIEERGGMFGDATHQRYRHYRADSLHTVAVALTGDEAPTLPDLADALQSPSRPLFLGRKCCLPAAPLLAGVVEAWSVLEALSRYPRTARSDAGPLPAMWPDEDPASGAAGLSRVVAVSDERDWVNRVHVGRRLVREGHVDPPEVTHG